MDYIFKTDFKKNLGFHIDNDLILKSVSDINLFLSSLPKNLYHTIDYKTTGAMIGAIFCAKIVENVAEAIVNPIEKGHPDIIPANAAEASEAELRNFPQGLEIKGTIGNLKTGVKLKSGESRIDNLTGITWQAHHRQVNNLMGIVWDFANEKKDFSFPAVTGAFFSDSLTPDDWGKISGTTGRNTKVTGMLKSGKEKMGAGWILIKNQKEYINKYKRKLYIDSF